MPDIDSFTQNIQGVTDLIGNPINKVEDTPSEDVAELEDVLALSMSDDDLLALSRDWDKKHKEYYAKIEGRAKQNKKYYVGAEYQSGLQVQKGIASNLIFEAQETFIPQALAKNPEPVVWSDNTDEGKEASNQIKAMLQFKADTMGLRKKLSIVLRHWDAYFIGIVKHGWDKKTGDIKTEIRNPKNFVWCDPEAYVDESGRYIGEALGERVQVTAKKLIGLFPKHSSYIKFKVDNRLGTKLTYTEYWTDEYCFSKFEDVILDKHKNEFFNYEIKEKNTEEEQMAYGLEAVTVTPGKNHFAIPIMPYSFFSVFTLQEQPHDVTNLIEQAIPNQDRIVERDLQVSKNLRNGNNSIAVSGMSFNQETARQAAQALEDGDPVLVPDGQVERAIKRLPAAPLPNGLLQAQEIDKQTLRQIFGTFGITPQKPNEETTARGQILTNNQDSSRIGGGIGESLEQLADNIFNWWLQLMYVFYDEPHYASIVGQGSAITYTQIINSNLNRQFVVSVSPDSMSPKDEITEQNQAISLFQAQALDPLTLFKKLNFPDPNEAASMLMMYKTNPAGYAQMLGVQPQMQPSQPGATPAPQEQGAQPPTLSAPTSSGALNQVPI